MQNRCIGIAALFMLSACVHTATPSQVRIADALVFDLLPPSGFGQNLLLTQAATVWFGDERHELLFYTEITADTVTIVGTLPGGARLFSIVYDGQTIKSEGYQELLRTVTPEYLLADLQISLWPLADVASSFAAANNCFQTDHCVFEETTDQLQRSLTRDDERVINIRYTGLPHVEFSMQYEHLERAYRLQIETLAVDVLEIESSESPSPPEVKP